MRPSPAGGAFGEGDDGESVEARDHHQMTVKSSQSFCHRRIRDAPRGRMNFATSAAARFASSCARLSAARRRLVQHIARVEEREHRLLHFLKVLSSSASA
jgi:hypothetical protein